jgi:hypothetical protein
MAVQSYPRVHDTDSKESGYLDDRFLVRHKRKISPEELSQLILLAIDNANKKSSRAMIAISEEASE